MLTPHHQMPKPLTPNEEYYLYNTSPEAYKTLGDGIMRLGLVHHGHAKQRGKFSEYPERMISVNPSEQLFVQCANCRRQHCTDPWMPGIGLEPAYVALNDRVRMKSEPDPHRPWLSRSLYYCIVDLDLCREKSK